MASRLRAAGLMAEGAEVVAQQCIGMGKGSWRGGWGALGRGNMVFH